MRVKPIHHISWRTLTNLCNGEMSGAFTYKAKEMTCKNCARKYTKKRMAAYAATVAKKALLVGSAIAQKAGAL